MARGRKILPETLEKAQMLGQYIIDNDASIGTASAHFNIAPSTLFYYIRTVLCKCQDPRAEQVAQVLRRHKAGRKVEDATAEKCQQMADFMIHTECSLSELAAQFSYSKSYTHQLVAYKLPDIDSARAAEVRKILDMNKELGPYKGGHVSLERKMNNENR